MALVFSRLACVSQATRLPLSKMAMRLARLALTTRWAIKIIVVSFKKAYMA